MLDGCYLAYPIDQRGPASLVHMFNQIDWLKRALVEKGCVSWVFDPGDAFLVNQVPQNDRLARINRTALNASDLVVAFLPRNVASIGVPMEIDRAIAQGKHVIVFSDARSYMLELPSLRRYPSYDIEVLDEAITVIGNLEPPATGLTYDELRVKVEVEGCLPRRTYPDDAGLDLVVSEDVEIPVGQFRDVPCGISVELPDWSWALVTGRSSAFRKRGLLILPGVIDAGYRGPIFAGVWNSGTILDGGNHKMPITLKKGERIAQMIVQSNSTRRLYPVAVPELNPSARGTDGFGSTGA